MIGAVIGLVVGAALMAVLIAALDTVIKGSLWALKKGQFVVTRNDAHAFRIKTDFGAFTIDRQAQLLRAEGTTSVEGMPLEWIDHIELEARTTTAGREEILNGLDWWDFMERYRDIVQWYRINLVNLEGPRRIHLFEVGQWVPKEPLSAEIHDAQVRVLARFGAYEDGEAHARDVLGQIQAAFEAAGHPISTTPGWVKAKRAEVANAAPPTSV